MRDNQKKRGLRSAAGAQSLKSQVILSSFTCRHTYRPCHPETFCDSHKHKLLDTAYLTHPKKYSLYLSPHLPPLLHLLPPLNNPCSPTSSSCNNQVKMAKNYEKIHLATIFYNYFKSTTWYRHPYIIIFMQ